MDYDSRNPEGAPSDVHMATVYARVAAASGPVRTSMYRVDVWDPGQMDPTGGECGGGVLTDGLVALAKYVDGSIQVLASSCTSHTRTGANTVTVTLQGGRIAVRTNGQLALEHVDPTPLRHGGVGVGQIWETNGSFDSVTVRRTARR